MFVSCLAAKNACLLTYGPFSSADCPESCSAEIVAKLHLGSTTCSIDRDAHHAFAVTRAYHADACAHHHRMSMDQLGLWCDADLLV